MTTIWPLKLSRIINDYAGPFYFWTEEEMNEELLEEMYQEFLAEETMKKWMAAEAAHEAAINEFGD